MQIYWYNDVWVIYLIKDRLHNRCYVGQKKGQIEKSKDYFGSGKIISKICLKRKHHLEKIILGYCGTRETLNEAEKVCIEFYQSNDKRYGYNLASGGEGGFVGKVWNKGKKCPPSWNKGLTKLSHKSLAKQGQTYKDNYAKGLIKNAWKGKTSNRKGCVPWNKGIKNAQIPWNKLTLDMEKIKNLKTKGYSIKQLVEIFNCSESTIYRRLR